MEQKRQKALEQLERMKEQAKKNVDGGVKYYVMHANCALEFADLLTELLTTEPTSAPIAEPSPDAPIRVTLECDGETREDEIRRIIRGLAKILSGLEFLGDSQKREVLSFLANASSAVHMQTISFICAERKRLKKAKHIEYHCTREEDCIVGIDKNYVCEHWKACRNCIYLEKKENPSSDEAPKGGADHD